MDPVATLKRIVDAVTLRRRVYVWMQFEPDATGDAIVIVAVTSLVLALAVGLPITLNAVLSRAISALVAWLIIAGLTWAAARWFYNSRSDYAPVLRVAGFAYPTTLLLLATLRLYPNLFGYYLSFVWFVAVMAAGISEVMELTREQAWGAAGAGFAAWALLQFLLGGSGFL